MGIFDKLTEFIEKVKKDLDNLNESRDTTTGKILNYIVGFRSRNKTNMLISTIYYILSLIFSFFMDELWFFTLICLDSIPFIVFAIIDVIKSKKLKYLINIPICFALILVATATVPSDENKNNENIKTFVASTSAPTEISTLEPTPEPTTISTPEPITTPMSEPIPEPIPELTPEPTIESTPIQEQNIDEESSVTVYVGKSGNKYHKKSCHTLKGGGIPISLEDAIVQGREACKICGG